MEKSDITPADILAENRLRTERLFGSFDPITGRGAPGQRFVFYTGLDTIPKLWLPVAMRGEPLLSSIMAAGGIPQYCHSLEGDYAANRERVAATLARLRHRYDFPFWAATTARIKNKLGGADILFHLNAPQRRLVETLEEMRLAGKPMRLVLLKARQWGGSTCVQVYMAWLQLVHREGLNSLILAHQGVASDEIKDMFDRLVDSYPEKLLETAGRESEAPDESEAPGRSAKSESPEGSSDSDLALIAFPFGVVGEEPEKGKSTGKTVRKMIAIGRSGSAFKVPARNCKIKVGTAERPDASRGGDYSLVHLSEVGLWPATPGKKPQDIVRAACSGVLYRPFTLIVYESTANGTGNFFHREYMAAAKEESQFRALFIAWYEIDQYRLPLFDLESYARRLLERRHDTREANCRQESGAYLWRLWQLGATLEGIHWYEHERAKYDDHGDMASEYPSDDKEAFVHSGCRVFSTASVEAFRDGCVAPVAVGEVHGNAFSGPDSLCGLRFVSDPLGSLQVWRMPEDRPRDRYLVVVDVGGRTARADWSVICVFDRHPMTVGEGPEVVAQWRGHIDIDLLVWTAARIAGWYGDALLVFESNTIDSHSGVGAEGDQSGYIFTVLSEAYPNLYMRRAAPDSVKEGLPLRYGFHTNARTKRMLVTNLVRLVREHGYMERDARCLDEMLAYERKPNGSYGAIDGHHDDILMTRAIGLYIATCELPPPVPQPLYQDSQAERRRCNRRSRPDLMF